jgi:hypothetical protein
MKPGPNYKKCEKKENKGKRLQHTQQMKPRPNYKKRAKKQRKKSTTQSMAMLKLRKQNKQRRTKKNCKYPLCTSSLLQCALLYSPRNFL